MPFIISCCDNFNGPHPTNCKCELLRKWGYHPIGLVVTSNKIEMKWEIRINPDNDDKDIVR